MKYEFENEIALEVYFDITKNRGIEIVPPAGCDTFRLTEESMMDTLKEIIILENNKKKQNRPSGN